MRVYLDNCCYNRPFDPQEDLRIHLETMAKVRVQALMKSGSVEYVWSDALDYELGQSPNFQEPDMITPWKSNAAEMVVVDDALIARGDEIVVMMSRSPEDYTTWHQRHFANGESVRELGEKIKAFVAAKRNNAVA